MIHSFLMAGQSNMAGRGLPFEVKPIVSPRIHVLRNGRWQSMYVPVNGDRPFSGISLAESFALRYSELHDVDVGLIPCADGGSSLTDWREGGILFDHAVLQCRLAMRTSELRAILWHQGESDCCFDSHILYEPRLRRILEHFRSDLGMPELPIILGELGEFLAQSPMDENLRNYPYINGALVRIASLDPKIAVASAKGLTSNPDMLHFNSKSLREFGLRYEAALERILEAENPEISADK